MDGTLVDTEGIWWQAVSEVALRLGGALTSEDLPDVVGRPVEHTANHLFRRTRGLPYTGLGGLGGAGTSTGSSSSAGSGRWDASVARDRPVADVEAMLTRAFDTRLRNGVTVFPGVIALLRDLRVAGIPTALVSASPRSIVDLVLETVGAHRFRLTVAAEDSERNKPSPDPYLTAAALLGVEASRCVAVEDSPTGLAAARAAGCAVVLVGETVVSETGVGEEAVAGDRMVSVRSLEAVSVRLLNRLVAGEPVGSNGNNG
jgi:HAD superfamily hydrolase (TIGR01509 family)